MKASELRVGNFVLDNDRIYKIYSGTEIGNIHNENTFKPIPLTEEWLVKFWFSPIMCFDVPRTIKCTKDDIIITSNKDEFDYWKEHDERIYIASFKYVHQLQNLYFALTGEELTIKE